MPAAVAGAYTQVLVATTYMTSNTNTYGCPLTYVLKTSPSGATWSNYAGSFLNFDGATGELTIDTNQAVSMNIYIEVHSRNGMVKTTNTFTVACQCASSGYTITPHASMPTSRTVSWTIDGNTPTFTVYTYTLV